MERNRSIDLVKGIGILLMITGHCIGFFQGESKTMIDNIVNAIINSYHMPLFFFVGGMLYKGNKTIGEIIKSRFEALIIPLVVFSILNGILTFFLQGLGLLKVIGDENIEMYLSIFKFQGAWFLISYFLVCVLFCFIDRFFGDRKVLTSLVVIILFVIALLVSAIDKNRMTSYVLTALVGMFFYYVGYIFKGIYQKKSRLLDIFLGFFLLLLCAGSGILLPNDIRMYSNSYENLFLFVINSILGCLGTVYLCSGIQRFRPIEFLGKLSLPTMAIQFPVYQAIAFTISNNESLWGFKVFPMCLVYYFVSIVFSVALAAFANKHFPLFAGTYRIKESCDVNIN